MGREASELTVSNSFTAANSTFALNAAVCTFRDRPVPDTPRSCCTSDFILDPGPVLGVHRRSWTAIFTSAAWRRLTIGNQRSRIHITELRSFLHSIKMYVRRTGTISLTQKRPMPTVQPRNVICVPGNWRDLDEVDEIVQQGSFSGFELDWEFSQLAPDHRMMDSFDASYDRVSPSMFDEDWEAVRTLGAVAYVLSPPIRKEQAADISGRALLLTAALLRGGAVAAKCEGAGIAHGRARWLALAEKFSRAKADDDRHGEGASLYWAWVRRPLLDDDERFYYSCGMHLLGKPDAEIEASLAPTDAIEWMDMLGMYLIGDRPTRPLRDGEGFRLKDEGPRRVIRCRPCARYEEDEFIFNPYGYIRLESEH